MKKEKKFIPIANPSIGEAEAQKVYSVVKKGWISMGSGVLDLEKKIKRYLKIKHAILFNNGTSALHAALASLDIKPGDEVIVPTLSYISSANVILYCGAKPIFCDSNPKTFNVTSEEIIKKITKKTKAIITVDLKGQPVDYDEIYSKLKKFNIPIISDSAESFGAEYKNKKVGSQFLIHSFSFFANKNITMGEGGLITTNNDKIANKCKIIRNQGQDYRYHHVTIGNNYRPTDYSAAIGSVQLKKIDKILKTKKKIVSIYNQSFKNYNSIITPYVPDFATRPSWYMYSLTFKNNKIRNKVKKSMEKNNIDTRLSFPPIHLQPIYKKKFSLKSGMFPKSENAYKTFLDIPIYLGMTKKDISRVVNCIIESVNE